MLRRTQSRPRIILAVTLIGIWLSGCGGTVDISGFRPVHPALQVSNFPAPMDIEWTKVESLTPTLSWQGLPGEHRKRWADVSETKPFVSLDLNEITNVRFNLQIWSAGGRRFPRRRELVYERKGIKGLSHRVEKPLKPGGLYLWTIRARFLFEGRPRASEWSMVMGPYFSRGIFVGRHAKCGPGEEKILGSYCLPAECIDFGVQLCNPREVARKEV